LGLAARFKFKAVTLAHLKFNRYAAAKAHRFCFNAFKLTNLFSCGKILKFSAPQGRDKTKARAWRNFSLRAALAVANFFASGFEILKFTKRRRF